MADEFSSHSSAHVGDFTFIPSGTNRLVKAVDFEEFMKTKSTFFEIAGESEPNNFSLENDADELNMKKKIIESQLKWNESMEEAQISTEYIGDKTFDHMDSYDTLADSMVNVKVGGSPLPTGALKRRMVRRGCGPNAKQGDLVWVHYKIFIEHSDEAFDDTFALGAPKRFTVGNGEVIAALDICIVGMNEGQTDHVLATHHYAFGPLGCEPRIPRESRVLLYITLMRIHFAGNEVPIEDLSPDDRRGLGFQAVHKAAEKRKVIGNDLLKQDMFKEAIQEYLRAQALTNELVSVSEDEHFQKENLNYAIQLNLALAYLSMEKFRKAVIHCNEALATSLKDTMKTKAYYRLSKALFEMGKMDEAEKNIKRAFALNCNDPHVKKLHDEITLELANRWKQEREMAQKMFGKLNVD